MFGVGGDVSGPSPTTPRATASNRPYAKWECILHRRVDGSPRSQDREIVLIQTAQDRPESLYRRFFGVAAFDGVSSFASGKL